MMRAVPWWLWHSSYGFHALIYTPIPLIALIFIVLIFPMLFTDNCGKVSLIKVAASAEYA